VEPLCVIGYITRIPESIYVLLAELNTVSFWRHLLCLRT